MIALLVGLAFLIIVGSVGFMLYSNWETTNREHAAATATANAQINATSTAQANATAHAHATATFIASHYPFSNNLVLDDPLSDNSKGNNWDVNTSSDGKEACQFAAGTYHAAALDPRYAYHCYARNTTFSNFTYQVQMVIIKGDLGGILFRLGQANNQDIGYRALISTQGDYTLESFDGQSYQIVGSGTNTAIKTGLNQSNLIAIVARGNTLELYVNEQFVMRAVNNTSSQGQIGVAASTSANQGHPTEVVFSNAKVWKL
jgi:hypothetical protein